MKYQKTPILFLVFNRPDTTIRVFDKIREYQPELLFIAADGPRINKEDDIPQCAAVREIVDDNIDWPCEVHRLYRKDNLGCRLAVSQAIDWFFENVEEGIILEDDTLPHSDFFPYCTELLDRYRDDDRIMHIGGFNASTGHTQKRYRYWASHHAWIWGWATWRHAWREYDATMSTWDARYYTLSKSFASNWERAFWLAAWRECRDNPTAADTWDFPWMYTVRSKGAISFLPGGNLVENIGFGQSATHTRTRNKNVETNTFLLSDYNLGHRSKVCRYCDELFTRFYSQSDINIWSDVKSFCRVILKKLADSLC